MSVVIDKEFSMFYCFKHFGGKPYVFVGIAAGQNKTV